jgi:hypothetical protein
VDGGWYPFNEGDIVVALEEIEEDGYNGEGGWIVLGANGVQFLSNGIGYYVHEYWELLK